MFQKLLSAGLAVVLILTGLVGVYAYNLNLQLSSLGEQLAQYQQEQRLGFSALADRLSHLEETSDNLSKQFETFQNQATNRLGSLETETGEIKAQLELAQDKLEKVTDTAGLQMNASQVYAQAVGATVKIGNEKQVVGSGFLYDRRGYVITASHVVEGLSVIFVTFADGLVFRAALVGKDQTSDVAVLSLNKTLNNIIEVEPLKLADSDQVVIGEPVAVIGQPLGTNDTITTGITSQKGRFVEIEYDSASRWVANVIQFDAAANYGNSGGPLLNRRGEVIGLVIARVNPQEGDGVNFAVSSNKVKRVASALIARGTYDYPWLGLMITRLTPQFAETSGLKTLNGVLVEQVSNGSPAETAGFARGDIITAINGTPVNEIDDLQSYLGEHVSPNETITITIQRAGKKLALPVKVGAL
ncbi:MAG: trypsin-like peptidase domain-containing protein [Chloroflexota bacterium]